MRTRSIVTSHPNLQCYVCERSLLRGEQPEEFFADGEPRTVCELCAPRAVREGWPRAQGGITVSVPVPRTRRARGLLARLRAPAAPAVADGHDTPVGYGEQAGRGEDELERLARELGVADGGEEREDGPLERGIAGFNGSEYPRRIAGLARSLGAPEVSVTLDDDLGRVSILVAWELCWYRYEADVTARSPEVRAAGQGTELAELSRSERLANALADELGSVSLVAVRA